MASPELMRRIHAEYSEMPGLRLTLAQAARLWLLDSEVARSVLESLVRDGRLARDRSGAYIRPSVT